MWGTGTPRREFLHVDDLAAACVYLMQHYSDESPINVGWGEDISIAELAQLIADMVGFRGLEVRSHASRMARRASCWIRRGSLPWAGARAYGLKEGLGAPMIGTARTCNSFAVRLWRPRERHICNHTEG